MNYVFKFFTWIHQVKKSSYIYYSGRQKIVTKPGMLIYFSTVNDVTDKTRV